LPSPILVKARAVASLSVAAWAESNWKAVSHGGLQRAEEDEVHTEGRSFGIEKLKSAGYLYDVSTIAEIERAIEQLPAAQVTALAAWLEEYRANLDSADPAQPGQKKSFMKFAGSLEGPADLSQRKGFSAT